MADKPTYEELEKRIKELEGQRSGHLELDLAALFQGFEDSFPVGITDHKGVILYVNNALMEMWGYSIPEEIIGRQLTDFWEGPGIYGTMEDLATKGWSMGEDIGKRKDNSLFPVEYKAIICNDIDGKPLYMLGQFFDISEKKGAEEALRKSEEKYRTLVETVTDAVLIVDPEGKLTYLNPQCERISGYRVEDLIGRSFTELLAPDYMESTLERFRRGLSGEESPIEEISILHKDGSQMPVEINATTLFDAEGKPVGRIGVVGDISERKRLEARLFQTQRLESIGVLAAGIAHDFDNILSIIRGFTDIAIREVPEKSRAKQNLDGALRGVQRAADLVKQIIAFSRQSKPEKRPVLVTPIVEDAVSLFRVSIPSTIEIRLDLQVGSGTVYAAIPPRSIRY